jgi:septum formation protein
MDGMVQIRLASRSPRRAALLAQLGLRYEIVEADVDETSQLGETAESLARRLAQAKAEAGARRCSTQIPVLGADTVVSLDEQLFGKPESEREAAGMLSALSGRSHEVHTAVCLATSQWMRTRVSRSVVRFRGLRPGEIERYSATVEPLGKAGGYAIQGMAAIFIEEIQGSYSGIMGLPLLETACLLAEAGIEVLDQTPQPDRLNREPVSARRRAGP